MWKHYTPAEFIKREMEQAGYGLQRESTFLDRQSFLIFAPGGRLESWSGGVME
jgi:hypothetical protein